jgi:acyl dehydratase
MTAIEATEGQELPGFSRLLTRVDLVRYAGASTDYNPIHYSDTAAAALGLPGVIAHGMLTMGTALRLVTDWAGDPGRVLSYQVRFTRPVVVDAVEDARLEVAGRVSKVVDGVATITLEVSCADQKVLGAATAEVRLD